MLGVAPGAESRTGASSAFMGRSAMLTSPPRVQVVPEHYRAVNPPRRTQDAGRLTQLRGVWGYRRPKPYASSGPFRLPRSAFAA